MNKYLYDTDLGVLIVSLVENKTLEDIKQVVNLNKPQTVVDRFIELYLPTTDPEQIAANKWYEQHLLVESLDPDEIRKPILDIDGNQTGEEPNQYDIALAERTAIEMSNPWLEGLRGLDAPTRPDFIVDVAQFKLDNPSLFTAYNKVQGVDINGVMVSLNESNQHGLADISVMIDKAISLGQTIFPINIHLETATGVSAMTIADQTEFDIVFLTFGLARQQFFN